MQKEREQTELAAITKRRCRASTFPGGFSGQFHIRLQTEAAQTFQCKEMGGGVNTGDQRGVGGPDEVGFVENSDTAERALKDLCVSFQRAERDRAMQLCGLIVRRHKYMRGLAVKAAQSIAAPRRGSGSFTCVRFSKQCKRWRFCPQSPASELRVTANR